VETEPLPVFHEGCHAYCIYLLLQDCESNVVTTILGIS